MTSQPDEPSYSDSHLDSPEYRQRLQRKLNCLIAVLEVACAKVRRSLTGKDADVERLTRIQKNLQDTLKVCKRAKRALERREGLPRDLPGALTSAVDGAKPLRARTSGGSFIEMSNPEELEKFEGMGPIDESELAGVNFDELSRLLQTGDDA
jgi:hypothetical protein